MKNNNQQHTSKLKLVKVLAIGYALAIAPFIEAAKLVKKLGLGLNAGHDLSLENLAFFHQQIPWVDEVSIGHALINHKAGEKIKVETPGGAFDVEILKIN